MKNYREVAETVLKRRDAYQKAKKRKYDIVMRTAAGAGVLCLAALLGLGIYQNSAVYTNDPDPAPGDPDVYYVASASGALNGEASGTLSDTDNAADGNDSLSSPAEKGNGNGGLISPEENTGSNGNGDLVASGEAYGDGLASPAESTGSDGLAAPGECTGSDGLASPAENAGSSAPGTPLPATGQEPTSDASPLLPVSYSSLSLPQGQVMPDIISAYAASSQSTADVLPFSEDLLSESSAILEGRITDMYLKRYSYDTYNDKFGQEEIYHNQSSSVVYELTVEKVWYGDESLAGTCVLIEDDIYLVDSYFSLKVGCSYVIPVSDLDQEKRIWGEYAGGDLTRDGSYTTLYPHHPQIEVTSDGDYIVTTDWETLCPDGARPIWLDIPENNFVEYHPENPAGEDGLITTEWRTLLVSAYDAVFYYDKVKLVSPDEFFIRLNRLIDQLP